MIHKKPASITNVPGALA